MKLFRSLTLALASVASFGALANTNTITGGSSHGLFVERGAVFAFGNGSLGACGPTAATQQFQPIYAGIDDVKSVSSAVAWNVALKNDGTVWYWGWNPVTRVKNFYPTQIPDLTGAEDVAITKNKIIALAGGQVYVYNFSGAPYAVQGVTNVVKIDAHENHVLAMTAVGNVYAFGENVLGQLGNGSTTASWTNATPVVDESGNVIGGVSKIDAGLDFSAVAAYGKVYVWGKNYSGSLGIGDTTTPFSDHAVMVDIDNVVDVSATMMSVLARKTDGSLWGWGWHNYITNGTYNTSALPAKLADYVDNAGSGQYDSFYLTVDGKREGWGSAVDGSLGTGNQTELHALAPLLDPAGYTFPTVAAPSDELNVATNPFLPVTSDPEPTVTVSSDPAVVIDTVTVTSDTSTGTTMYTNVNEPTETVHVSSDPNGVVILSNVAPVTKRERKGNNGWGNGNQNAPGNSAGHNNAENNTSGKSSPCKSGSTSNNAKYDNQKLDNLSSSKKSFKPCNTKAQKKETTKCNKVTKK